MLADLNTKSHPKARLITLRKLWCIEELKEEEEKSTQSKKIRVKMIRPSGQSSSSSSGLPREELGRTTSQQYDEEASEIMKRAKEVEEVNQSRREEYTTEFRKLLSDHLGRELPVEEQLKFAKKMMNLKIKESEDYQNTCRELQRLNERLRRDYKDLERVVLVSKQKVKEIGTFLKESIPRFPSRNEEEVPRQEEPQNQPPEEGPRQEEQPERQIEDDQEERKTLDEAIALSLQESEGTTKPITHITVKEAPVSNITPPSQPKSTKMPTFKSPPIPKTAQVLDTAAEKRKVQEKALRQHEEMIQHRLRLAKQQEGEAKAKFKAPPSSLGSVPPAVAKKAPPPVWVEENLPKPPPPKAAEASFATPKTKGYATTAEGIVVTTRLTSIEEDPARIQRAQHEAEQRAQQENEKRIRQEAEATARHEEERRRQQEMIQKAQREAEDRRRQQEAAKPTEVIPPAPKRPPPPVPSSEDRVKKLQEDLAELQKTLEGRKRTIQTNDQGQKLLGYDEGFSWCPKCWYVSNISKVSELKDRLRGCQRGFCEGNFQWKVPIY